MTICQHFNLRHIPLGKGCPIQSRPRHQARIHRYLDWVLENRGIGLITGETGIGKSTSVRAWCDTLNPNTHPVTYQSDNHFQAFDVYSQLGDALGLGSYHRYALLWRALKKEIRYRYQEKKRLTVWVLDEAQQLKPAFLSSLPAFLNMDFDTREYLSIVFIATPDFYRTLQRASYAALYSRLHGCCQCNPLSLDGFMSLSSKALEASGAAQGLFPESSLQLLHCACQGRLREAHQLMSQALHIAAHEGLTHVTEAVVEKAIEQLNNKG